MADERDDLAEFPPAELEPLDEGSTEPDDAESAPDIASEAASDAATQSLRELVTFLVDNLVDEPENVDVLVDRRGSAVHIQLRLPETDLGKVIGRGGRIAKAIRTVLLIAGSRHNLRVTLDIES
jgi:predicted RNA-binding protein YlqC (UPF0109 family)